MAITIRQLWNEYIFRSMAHQANVKGGLFANGVIAYDTSPTFRQGDTRHRVPSILDLDTILGVDDQRLVDGTDLTIKSADGIVHYSPIVYRGDAWGQSLISQTQMGTDVIRGHASQLATRALNQIERRLSFVVSGAFGTGGPVATSHVYDVRSRQLSIGDPKRAKANIYGQNADDVSANLMLVSSAMQADLYNRSLLTYATLNAAANPQAINTGQIELFGGARLAVNDRICTTIDHAFTSTFGTDTLSATAHGFVDEDAVVFTGADLPAPLVAGTTYYVIATGLTADEFQVSATLGGAAVNLSDDGTGDMTVNGGQYYSYLVAPSAFYVGIQRDFNVTEFEKHLDGGKKFVQYWTQFYAPSINGLSYNATTVNPEDADLATGSDWSLPGDARDVGIVRIISKIGQPG